MRPLALLAAALLTACAASDTPLTAAPPPPSGTLFTGGTIYTGSDAMPVAGGVLVGGDGRIAEVVAPGAELPAAARTVDLEGAVMFPGFTDAHAHLIGIGQRELTLDLTGTGSVAALVARIEAELEALPAGQTLVGRGWIETGWPERRMPVAADLDPVSPDNSVILVRADGHALLANSAALKAAGIDAATPDPEGGAIERDGEGRATGLLVDKAMPLVMQLAAEPSEADEIAALAKGAEIYAARGWTGLHNMSVDPAHAPLLERLDAEGRLPIRLYNAYDPAGFDLAATRAYETDTITNRAVKTYMDGALGSRGALLAAPYADRPGTVGLSLLEPEALTDLIARADAASVQLAIHAIGDLANTRVVDAMAAYYGDEPGRRDHRHRIEHTQILNPADIPRLAPLGLIASMQPSHAIGDLHFAPARLGLARLDGAYAWRDVIDAGTIIAGGSDAPVEVGSPLIEFYAAVARRDLSGFSGEGWHPEQAVTRAEALKLFTLWPAYAAFQENDLGTIEPDKLADFTIFDRDLMTVPAREILTAQPVMTVVGGDIVWQSPDSLTKN